MSGFRKYLAKLLVVYITLTNVMTPTAFAAQLSSVAPQQQAVSQDSTPTPEQPTEPVEALPVSSNQFNTFASVSALTTDDGTGASAHERLGVSVQKLFKHDFKADENITMTLDNPDQESYKTKITDASGNQASVQLQASTDAGETQLQVIPTNEFKPGKYTISVTDQEGKTTSQDFTWGVLALNPDKAIYAPKEAADFSMAVLDDKGRMVCDAPVTLTISNEATGTSDTLSTENKTIIVNPECTSHNFTLKPDYEAHYLLGGEGKYDLTLTAKTGNGPRTITETIEVKQSVQFDVQRVSATRIYPPNEYPMKINVTANRDFTGTVTETVPDSFDITPADTNKSYDDMNTVYLDDSKGVNATVSKQILGASTGRLVMPFDGNYQITQGFGAQLTDTSLAALYDRFGLAGHDGIDFGLPMGTPLYAVDDGKIVWSGPGDYGIQIIIQHSWGKTYYGHLSKTAVEKDADVKKGSLIGYSGMSGEATGPHLHFGMKPNNPDMDNGYSGKVDPMPYLPIGNTNSLSSLPLGNVLTNVLGASTSAGTPTPTLPMLIPTSAPASHSAVVMPAPRVSPTPASMSAQQQFTVTNSVIQQSAEDQPQTLAEVKVITWHVSMKKGDTTTLSYSFQAPKISPQFYLIGSLNFYTDSDKSLVYDEGRQWQIAADDLGTAWYHPATNQNSGYEWPYRKKITIDHTKVGADSIQSVQSSLGGTTADPSTITVNNVQPGDLLVLMDNWDSVSSSPGGLETVTDNRSDGWTRIASSGQFSSNYHVEMWYAQNVVGGNTTITLSHPVSFNNSDFIVSEYSGVDPTNALDQNAGTIGSVSNTTVNSTNTLTTDTANELLVGVAGTDSNNAASTFTGGSGYTVRQKQTSCSAHNCTGLEDKIVSSTGTYNATATISSAKWGARIATFRQASAQYNYPVLVDLSSDNDLKAHMGQTNANDLLFTDANGNKLNHQVEAYNSTTGELEAWVKVPSLSSTTDTTLYMYYGNGSIANQQAATSVWDSNFQGVYHLGETAACATTLSDSTSVGNNGSCGGSPTAGTGQIDGARTMSSASSQYLSINGLASDTNLQTGSFSQSFWFKVTSTFTGSTATQELMDIGGTGTSHDDIETYLDGTTDGSTGRLIFPMYNSSGTETDTVNTTNTTWTGGTWYFVTAVYNAGSLKTNLYVNGNSIASNTVPARGGTNATVATFGRYNHTIGSYFNGTVDELRLSNNVRSSGWVTTDYNNQLSPGTFYSVGTEEGKTFAATNDMLMRHGKFFDNSGNNYGEQPFLF